MAKRPPINTRAALSKAIRDAVVPAPSALRVKLGSSVYTVAGEDTFIGTLSGKGYGALALGERTLLLFRIDNKDGASTARMLSSAEPEEIEAIAADLLPEPEESAEVKAHREQLAGLKAPKGYRYAVNAKGGLELVEADGTNAGGSPPRSGGATLPNAPSSKPAPKPAVEVGVEVRRRVGKEAGRVYRITKVETTGYAIFTNVADSNDDIREMVVAKNGKLPPAFWNRWEELA